MPCDTRLKPRQTVQQRADEIRKAIAGIDRLIRSRLVKIRVGPQGAIAFEGIPDSDRNGVTDACIYRRLLATGSTLAKAYIARAEQISGRAVDRRVVAAGVHSHDGGMSWHGKG